MSTLMNPLDGVKSIALPTFDTFEDCERYTRHHAKSFYFSSFLLPAEKRKAAYAIYSFCRYADDTIDRTAISESVNRAEVLNSLREFIDNVYSSSSKSEIRFHAFRETVEKYRIPRQHFLDLLEGVMMDLDKNRYDTFDELHAYCYKVASVVGLIMSEIFGYTNSTALQHAADLGTAMQLTNILRDVYDDMLLDRVYLPKEDLARFNYSESDIREQKINESFIELMKFQIERARGYYRSADRGIHFLTNDGSRSTVVMMNRIYGSILDQIEKHRYDIYSTRRYVSTNKKIALTLGYFLNLPLQNKYRDDAKRNELPLGPKSHQWA